MEEFSIKGEDGFIKISLFEVHGFPEKTCHWGGYDAKVKLELMVGGYFVNSSFYTSTGELHKLYEGLIIANKNISGKVEYSSYEGNLTFSLTYKKSGQVEIEGEYSERHHLTNKLIFEFESDQSYINSSLNELEIIVNKYGGMTGVKNGTQHSS